MITLSARRFFFRTTTNVPTLLEILYNQDRFKLFPLKNALYGQRIKVFESDISFKKKIKLCKKGVYRIYMKTPLSRYSDVFSNSVSPHFIER